ncbi:MAG: type II toxin-antitoxin system RelE/ParE family toxin [Actinobacteria bacterium]|uniref:Unannotated protein n=1 Tax=freshwater metagenome TaxID=449393 RepID=A0A6J7W7Q3_9ZZZZ|nr:type II toxin-antitoxin system RelE/ParE family toxin [Actinomycetota bacterium]
MRIFKTRHFTKWTRKSGLTDDLLVQAVTEMQQGLIDANLGSGLFKKRIGIAGRGKRGGVRTLVATNKDDRWFFVYGFEKNVVDNISSKAVAGLQDLASDLLSLDDSQLNAAVEKEVIEEIGHG